MARRRRIDIVLSEIEAQIDSKGDRVYSRAEFERLYNEIKISSALPASISANQFIKHLVAKSRLTQVVLKFPSRNVHRYYWGKISRYQIAQSLDSKAYFSQETALYFHQLIDDSPNAIYLNLEQSPKPSISTRASLTQDRIDYAFKSRPRITNAIAEVEGLRLFYLSGKHTNRLGVVEGDFLGERGIRVTNVERTLVDIAVRPFYAGGTNQVLRAYSRAKGKFSAERLLKTLQEIAYVYPYEQVIGFYLERSEACREEELQLFEKHKTDLKLYLNYGLKNPDYSERWKIYFPRAL